MTHSLDADGTNPSKAEFRAAWLDLAHSFVSARPTASHRAGLDAVRELISTRLSRTGFSVTTHAHENAAPVVIAVRPGAPHAPTIGLFAHYDVEEAGDGWNTEPFVPTIANDRLFARGIGDNLGPLALRLLALEDLLTSKDRFPTLLWVLQGEEEIGSPWAHVLFPKLEWPTVDLWLEETGYFEEDRTQRILARRISSRFAPVVESIVSLARSDGREVRILDRYLNKAFGEARCPCLTHLVKNGPYLAIGPNDTRTRIHASNESLPLDTLELSRHQFVRTLIEVARCA